MSTEAFPAVLPVTEDLVILADAYLQTSAEIRRLTEIKDVLSAQLKAKAEEARLTQGWDNDARVAFEGEGYSIALKPVGSWRVDARKLKAEYPEHYAACAKHSIAQRLEVKPL